MNQQEFLAKIGGYLEAAGIPFMVTGSLGSSYHGLQRATQDVDLVIDPTSEQLEQFLAAAGEQCYVSAEAARDALKRRSMFNIIEFEASWKADLIVRKDRPFSIEEFSRRQIGSLFGRTISLATAEDVILSKLEWNKITASERQVQDALNVALVQGPRLDKGYMRKWGPSLGISDQLEDLLRRAEEGQRGPTPNLFS